MSKKLPIVALIGQTNAGKSALFNRLVGRQDAIVAREAGTTRDSVVRVTDKFILVDTAGLKDPEDDFEATIQDQIEDAISSADVIIFVKDRTLYPDNSDKNIARKALKSRKPVILALNKSDLREKISPDEYLNLGIKEIVEVSAEHSTGITKLRDNIEKSIPKLAKSPEKSSDPDRAVRVARRRGSPEQSFPQEKFSGEEFETGPEHPEDELDFADKSLKVALIGRPNVGKSHLFNRLAGKQQAIVAPIAGTTRDINRIGVRYHNRDIELLDTAGVRRKGKIERGIEKFSILRTVAAIEESDICLLLMDVNELNTAVDQSLAGMITEAGKGIIIVVTKWDDESPGLLRLKPRNDNELVKSSDPDRAVRVARRRGSPEQCFLSSEKFSGEEFETGPEHPEDELDFADALPERDTAEILHSISQTFDFIPYAPVILTSSVTGKNVTKIFEIASEITKRRQIAIPTRKLNDMLQKAVASHPPAGLKNTLPKMRYMVQTDVNPPWFVIYGANFKHIHWSYKRYLERQMREAFDFAGTPIRFSFRDEKQIKANKERERN
jgi:ribosome-associated GTPase EngA